jgi:uncharacterized membrane protein AbrB (regulator of aidB expression)
MFWQGVDSVLTPTLFVTVLILLVSLYPTWVFQYLRIRAGFLIGYALLSLHVHKTN